MRHIKRAETGLGSYVPPARSNKVDEVVRTGPYFFCCFFFFFFFVLCFPPSLRARAEITKRAMCASPRMRPRNFVFTGKARRKGAGGIENRERRVCDYINHPNKWISGLRVFRGNRGDAEADVASWRPQMQPAFQQARAHEQRKERPRRNLLI